MKKFFGYLMALTMTMTVFTGCSGGASDAGSAVSEADGAKVALLTSVGGLGDRSFSDAAWSGFQKAEEELGVEIKVVEPQSVADYQTSLTSVANSGFEAIMVVGNDWADALSTVAPTFPETKFLGVNIDVEAENVSVAKFSDHEGSFIVGALAALMSETGKIGFIGGSDVPAINRFYVGYEEGAKYVRPEIEVIPTYIGSFADPGKGKEFALQLISQNVDIIFQAAGKSGEGLFEALKETEGVYGIGVDQDQDYIVEGKILTSMIKKVDVAAYDHIENVVNDTFEPGIKVYGLKENGVGPSEMTYTKDQISEEVLAQVETIRQAIIDGTIKVTDVFEQ